MEETISMRTRTLLWAFLLTAFTVSALAAEPFDDVVWLDAKREAALFVPQALLGAKPRVALPSSGYTQYFATLEAAKRATGALPCSTPTHDLLYASTLAGGSTPLWDALSAAPAAVTAEVVKVVPGWSAWTGEPASAVWVRISELVSGSARIAGAGTLRVLLLPMARIEVEGLALCSARPGFDVPKGGDRLLLAVAATPHDERLLAASYVFPIVDGEIVARPYGNIAKFQRLSLNDLRGAIRRGGEVRR
jgi:hypothetical protein